MAKTNNPREKDARTHEGAPTFSGSAEAELRRTLMTCLLWEDSTYEDGTSTAGRIAALVAKVPAKAAFDMAVEARTLQKLRHAPLLVAREMARLPTHKHLVADLLSRIILRPDELTEFVSLYWKDGRQTLSAQVKKGLARAFTRFNAYSLAKYDGGGAVKLRDVLFLTHAKPIDDAQAETWKKLVEGKLEAPDTWEVALSSGADKKATWERLLSEGKLGAMALLRNLRNMREVGVDQSLVKAALGKVDAEKVLPFRYVAAARHAPELEPEIEKLMLKATEEMPKLRGKTILLVDVSGSMDYKLSTKSDMTRLEAANGLAILAREVCEDVTVITFSDDVVVVPPRRGFALRDAVVGSQKHSSTYLGKAVVAINSTTSYDRIIVMTDEQSHDAVPQPKGKGYMVNVATYQNSVAHGAWTSISGWSEQIVAFIQALEG